MAHSGRCRCGLILRFRRSLGYKTVCARCGAVVRLRRPATDAPALPHAEGGEPMLELEPLPAPPLWRRPLLWAPLGTALAAALLLVWLFRR
jgi:hypothetical protein